MRNVTRFVTVLLLAMACAACVAPGTKAPPAPPATPNFVFNPPDQAKQKLDKAVAIVGPKTSGTMWGGNVFDAYMYEDGERNRSRGALAEMLKASRVDLEKTMIARGFNTVGPFVNIDEMTFTQKERAFVLFEPVFDTNLEFVAARPVAGLFGVQKTEGNVTTRGSVTLAFYEPLSREKVWLKRVELTPISEPYLMTRQVVDGKVLSYSSNQSDAVVRSLNKFYTEAMGKIWSQIDPREISALQKDVDQLKAKKRF